MKGLQGRCSAHVKVRTERRGPEHHNEEGGPHPVHVNVRMDDHLMVRRTEGEFNHPLRSSFGGEHGQGKVVGRGKLDIV